MAESVPHHCRPSSSPWSHHEWPSQDPTPQYHTVARMSLLACFPSPGQHCAVLPGAGVTTSNCRSAWLLLALHMMCVFGKATFECPCGIQHTIFLWWLEKRMICPSHPPALFMTIYLVSSIGQGIKRYVFPPAFSLGIQYDIIFMGFSRITSSPCTTHIWERKKINWSPC